MFLHRFLGSFRSASDAVAHILAVVVQAVSGLVPIISQPVTGIVGAFTQAAEAGLEAHPEVGELFVGEAAAAFAERGFGFIDQVAEIFEDPCGSSRGRFFSGVFHSGGFPRREGGRAFWLAA